ncbi:MAG: hypothetical protein J7647_17825 [Cyanobacteria bacterium SBLK]|nr:hypothetical protein [Cyanobacteria bacterium SBLK]
MQHTHLKHQFVTQIPEQLQAGVLYISMEYATAIHLCCCGCGEEVVTPLTPHDWNMKFDGETVTLSPSIGNWSFACRSHYFIRRGRIIKAGSWTNEEVEANRRIDRVAKADYYSNLEQTPVVNPTQEIPHPESQEKTSFLRLWLDSTRAFWRNLRRTSKH